MKTLGMIGGLGPESTIDYYRLLVSSYRSRTPDDSLPSIIINSLDVNKGLRMLDGNDLPGLAAYLAGGVEKLVEAGADFAIIAANTPHLVFDEVQSRSSIPLLSIVEATRDAVRARGIAKVGLLGTGFTMKARFYPDVFSKAGIELAVPGAEERAYIHDKYIDELLLGIFLPETRERLLVITQRMVEQEQIAGLVLAGTELPLILRAETIAGVPLFDTTKIHVEATVDRMFS